MKVFAGIYEYIDQHGGKKAFEPTQNPDNYLELCQQINQLLQGGDRELMDITPQEVLDFHARYYLGLPTDDNTVII
jgi:hypothetical protein